MDRTPRSRRTGRCAIAGVAALATIWAGGSLPTASAHDDDHAPTGHEAKIGGIDPASVWMSNRIEGYRMGKRLYLSGGPYLVAGSKDLRIESHRASWNDKIVTTWQSGARTGTFPAGTQRTFDKLPKFSTVKLLRGKKVLATRKVAACLNNGATRVEPKAAATSSFPLYGCPMNPFTVGSLQGIPAGWATPLFMDGSLNWKVPSTKGKLKVRVTIADGYATAMGIPASARTRTAKLVFPKVDDEMSMRMRSRTPATAGVTGVATPAPRPTQRAAGSTGPRPDLRSLPAYDISVNRKGTQLRFAATVWNAGDSPLVVDGYRNGMQNRMTGYQYFFDSDGTQVGYQQVGELQYHAANHNHWHFEDFARYRLLDANKKPLRTSGKVSFCLANTDAIDYTVEGADVNPDNTDLSTACGDRSSLSIREVLASGSGDTYAQFRAGQAIPLKGIKPGKYFLAVEANPGGRLIEQSTTNNIAYRTIWIKGAKNGRHSVKAGKVGIIDDKGFAGMQ